MLLTSLPAVNMADFPPIQPITQVSTPREWGKVAVITDRSAVGPASAPPREHEHLVLCRVRWTEQQRSACNRGSGAGLEGRQRGRGKFKRPPAIRGGVKAKAQ